MAQTEVTPLMITCPNCGGVGYIIDDYSHCYLCAGLGAILD